MKRDHWYARPVMRAGTSLSRRVAHQRATLAGVAPAEQALAEERPDPSSTAMPTPRCKPSREADRRRALELLAASPDGATEAILAAHGMSVEQMVDLVRAGLATATTERVAAGRSKHEVATVRITEAGRRALDT
jgi:hypothetical protein